MRRDLLIRPEYVEGVLVQRESQRIDPLYILHAVRSHELANRGRVMRGLWPHRGRWYSPRVDRSPIEDTTPAAARVQLDLLRRAGVGRRAALLRSLSGTVIDLSRSAQRARMPDASERDVLLRWVALTYGDELARRVRAYLQARGR